ncbi:hypothetical protein LXL04_025442 [Taraxacum kok-saghyz]
MWSFISLKAIWSKLPLTHPHTFRPLKFLLWAFLLRSFAKLLMFNCLQTRTMMRSSRSSLFCLYQREIYEKMRKMVVELHPQYQPLKCSAKHSLLQIHPLMADFLSPEELLKIVSHLQKFSRNFKFVICSCSSFHRV